MMEEVLEELRHQHRFLIEEMIAAQERVERTSAMISRLMYLREKADREVLVAPAAAKKPEARE